MEALVERLERDLEGVRRALKDAQRDPHRAHFLLAEYHCYELERTIRELRRALDARVQALSSLDQLRLIRED